MKIKLKGLMEEDLQDYKKAGIFLAFPSCNWKCLKEINQDISICQNSHLAQEPIIEYELRELWNLYSNNPITESWILGGLEPLLSFEELVNLIKFIRWDNECNDDIVIFTGYYENEIQEQINRLKQFENVIVKFGRFVPDKHSKYDDVLGVTLISDNQYAKRIGD